MTCALHKLGPLEAEFLAKVKTADVPVIDDFIGFALGQDFADFDGTPGTGRSALWARLPDALEMSAATLAILGAGRTCLDSGAYGLT